MNRGSDRATPERRFSRGHAPEIGEASSRRENQRLGSGHGCADGAAGWERAVDGRSDRRQRRIAVKRIYLKGIFTKRTKITAKCCC